ncbi:MAG: putative metal-binding motif-containing protein [Pseudomonadota bacterium]|nr:putative metal-binding motif-containing protein [Pseudomonadota bacterium]
MRLTLLLASLFLAGCTDGGDPKETGTGPGTDLVDADDDGYLASVDCDEADAAIHPGAAETCDGVDEDCDTVVDNDVGTAWYTDADEDGYGDLATEQLACEQPANTVADATDCDDTSATFNPSATEDCADPTDYNCDGSVGYEDGDLDGAAACLECNDGDATVYPGAAEACNGVDDNCDGVVDEGAGTIFYLDADGDGFGDAATTGTACTAPEGYVANADDCDDTNPGINPAVVENCDDPTDYNCDGSVGYADDDGDGVAACEDCNDADAAVNPSATEVCNLVDDDCDGSADEDDAADAGTWYYDADSDGYGRSSRSTVSCDAPADYVASGDDCDDLDDAVYPAATETCDGEDDDCDGDVDEDDAVDPATWYADSDDDGYGDADLYVLACDAPSAYVANATDCDDGAATTNPGADETCDEVDNDCDGSADESSAVDAPTWYADVDDDGAGNASYSTVSCDAPSGYADNDGDCDDNDDEVSHLLPESCDGKDNDCDGDSDEYGANGELTWYADVDADAFGDPTDPLDACDQPVGYLSDATDCDGSRDDVNPGAPEVCDASNVDEDCDGSGDESGAEGEATWYADVDGDAYGDENDSILACDSPAAYVADKTDCDDLAAAINPAATEICDAGEDDEDCDGLTDDDDASVTGTAVYYLDSDDDGYGDATVSAALCDSSGYASTGDDCDDDDATTNPAGTEVCDFADNDCDGTVDDGIAIAGTYYPDEDDDGFGDPAGVTVDGCAAPVGYRLDNSDCDDGDITVHPYAWENTTNAVDDDCDGGTDSADTSTVTAGPQTDDSSATVTFSTMTFPFCGTNRTTAYMISNGRVTFGTSGDTDYSESSSDFVADTAIAPLWDDFNPASSSGGDTYYIQYPDAVGFYWVDLRELSATTTNNFSVVLFDDGRMLFQYAGIASTDGMVGYSCAPGGTAVAETDFSAASDGLAAGRWGIGTATATMYYELFTASDNDLDNRVIRVCGNPDNATDNCEE